MARQTQIRAQMKDGAAEVRVRVTHPMETGQRVDRNTKKKIPAHYIQKMTFALNGKQVAVTDLGPAISKDPLVGVRLKGAKAGDKVTVTWNDNMGESGSAEAIIK
ncbi:MAG: thiosulfate oxidation carrier complex protein SoxZ [Acidithiobacillales bacterium SM23_46]|jgi:sulfur-oxidizing protein SoxZ|nr:MAG: thiosulfate oxidation carrier complex protein SoxZ [Acidithiobacillales bacterium SM23_46]KPL28128.1 MAG: thiosulfate oxidation carrier complex protein SoxZ [Acidithiobacillales bacterium SM1_46]